MNESSYLTVTCLTFRAHLPSVLARKPKGLIDIPIAIGISCIDCKTVSFSSLCAAK